MEIFEEEDSEIFDKDILGNTFFKKYYCTKKLGEGSFGYIYQAEYNGEEYALKFEEKINGPDLLSQEAIIMNYLQGSNIPKVMSYGFNSSYNILVMQLLGKSLENILKELNNFSLKTVSILAIQMITVLEYIHKKHIVHRDIKPDNFVMGLGELSSILYLIDFGLARKYRSSETLEHYPLVKNKRLTGTARYASINALMGYTHSRRDDLESVGYVIIYLLKGSLPWQGIKAKTKEEKYKIILRQKKSISSNDLCDECPLEFKKYLDYVKKLEYKENPNYEKLKNLFNIVIDQKDFVLDYIYDWTTNEEIKSRKDSISKTETEPANQRTSVSGKKSQEKKCLEKNEDKEDKEKKKENDECKYMIIEEEIGPQVSLANGPSLNGDNYSGNYYIHRSNFGTINRKIKEKEEIIRRRKIRENNVVYSGEEQQQVVCCEPGCLIF